jgi:hypothetical protein
MVYPQEIHGHVTHFLFYTFSIYAAIRRNVAPAYNESHLYTISTMTNVSKCLDQNWVHRKSSNSELCVLHALHLMCPSMSASFIFRNTGVGCPIVGTHCWATMAWDCITARMTQDATMTWDHEWPKRQQLLRITLAQRRTPFECWCSSKRTPFQSCYLINLHFQSCKLINFSTSDLFLNLIISSHQIVCLSQKYYVK